jgi:D-alanyl-D-alanine carboxypeptidase/D-alanyl-D-alanine-endopeptidase (penicillin-binding protein 4)
MLDRIRLPRVGSLRCPARDPRAPGVPCVLVAAVGLLLAASPSAGAAPESSPLPSPPRRLVQRLDAALASEPPGSTVGVAVISGPTGKILYAHDAERLLVPASNAKIFTLGAALATLGPSFVFRTEVLAGGPVEAGVLHGPIVLRGGGDPSLTSEGLWGLALDVEAAGLRRVAGDLILDDSLFDRSPPPAAGPGRNEGRPYGALASALTLNFNTVAVEVAPGRRPGEPVRAATVPPVPGLRLSNGARTGAQGKPDTLCVSVSGPSPPRAPAGTVTLSGAAPAGGPPRRVWRSAPDPAILAGATFKEFLKRADIPIAGKLRKGTVPPGAETLAVRESPPLAVLAREVGKRSNNLYAELILRALSPAAPRRTGDGIQAVQAWLARKGVLPGAVKIVDGSGLSRQNRASALVLARVLREAADDPETGAEFRAALSIAGVDGTLEKRFTDLRGRVRGKSGYLDGVSALSGWTRGRDGEEFFFSILINGARLDPGAAKALEDRVVRVLARDAPAPGS